MRISDWSSDVGSSDLLDALDAVDRLLHRRVEVLHAEAGAVEADVGHAGDVGGRDEARVELDRDVARRRAREAELAAQRLHQLLQLAAVEEVGRAAAQVHLDHLRSEEHTSELQSLMRISYAVFCLKEKKT